jgi:diaminopimelate epimerase
MHGLGNDFVVLDARAAAARPMTPPSPRALADRRTGIGCDQLIVLEPARPRLPHAHLQPTAARSKPAAMPPARWRCCTARRRDRDRRRPMRSNRWTAARRVDMGEPRFDWDAIPLAYAMDTFAMPVGWDELRRPMAVNVGNPHVMFFVDDADAVPLDMLGPQIEHDPLFPERVNVNVATVPGPIHPLRVWERGAGLTRACGTGACATAVAAMRRGLVEARCGVTLPGGDLVIAWGRDGTILMTGPATESFRGTFDWDDFA